MRDGEREWNGEKMGRQRAKNTKRKDTGAIP